MKAATLTLRREDLVSANACAEWLAFFDQVCTLRGEDRAPWVRRDGVSRRDPSRLRIELTPLAQVWLSLPLSASSGVAWVWLRERNLVGSVFARGANLRGANLRGANLYGANLRGADLYGANLRGADLYGANLRGASLYGANLYGADLYGADLRGADLRGADLRGADLYGADLRGANLRGANLYGANLRGADLYDADLYDADLYGANRWSDDAPLAGWSVRNDALVRS